MEVVVFQGILYHFHRQPAQEIMMFFRQFPKPGKSSITLPEGPLRQNKQFAHVCVTRKGEAGQGNKYKSKGNYSGAANNIQYSFGNSNMEA
jgi:hypothetical protein